MKPWVEDLTNEVRGARIGLKIFRVIRNAIKRKRAEKQKQLELPMADEKDTRLVKPLSEYRTSTKTAMTTFGPAAAAILALVPFYNEANALIMQACESENGPVLFLGGWIGAAAVAVITARRSKAGNPNATL